MSWPVILILASPFPLNLDIASFIEYDYYYGYIEVTDTADFEWSATDDSITLIFFDEYEDYGYSSRFLEGTIVTYLHRKGLIVTDKHSSFAASEIESLAGVPLCLAHHKKQYGTEKY